MSNSILINKTAFHFLNVHKIKFIVGNEKSTFIVSNLKRSLTRLQKLSLDNLLAVYVRIP